MPISGTSPILDEKFAQLRGLGRDAEIAQQGHLEPGAQRETVDCGNRDLVNVVQVHVKIDEGIEVFLELLEGHILQRVNVQRHVASGGEMIAGAGKDDGANRFFALESGKALLQSLEQVGTECVQLIRAVEGYDGIVVFSGDKTAAVCAGFFGHSVTPSLQGYIS